MRAVGLSAVFSLLMLRSDPNGAEMRFGGTVVSKMKAKYSVDGEGAAITLFKESASEQYTLACTIPQLKVGRYAFGERQAGALLIDRQTPYYSRYVENGLTKHTVGYIDIQTVDATSKHVRGTVNGKVLKLPNGKQAAQLVELVATFNCVSL